MNIGNKIKKYRENLGLSQDELALKVFVSRQTISNWETDKTYPDINSLTLLSKIFHVTLDEFVKGDLSEMKKKIDEGSLHRFNSLTILFSVELIVLVMSAHPLFVFLKGIGIMIWIVLFGICLFTAWKLEKFKKDQNIQTYKEILAFYEGKILSHDEIQQEFGKRNYQKVLGAVLSGMLTALVLLAMILLFDFLGWNG